jgi:TolB protein
MRRLLPLVLSFFRLASLSRDQSIGQFNNQQDIGTLLHAGSASFEAKTNTYTLSASGENMWGAKDAFHFLFAQARGDLSISADIAFKGAGADKHRKACLMFRQSLDADAAYIDVALHGDGLTSLQFRESKGGLTHEIQSNSIAPKHLRLEKRGQSIYLYLESQFSGASHRITFQEPFYVGLALCSHNKDVTESATFSSVTIDTNLKPTQSTLYNTLETQSISSTDRRVVFASSQLLESPAWTVDGTALLFSMADQRYLISAIAPSATPQPTSISAVGLCQSNISPDGKRRLLVSSSADSSISTLSLLAISSNNTDFLANLTAVPGLSVAPCWSPDSKKIAFVSNHLVP